MCTSGELYDVTGANAKLANKSKLYAGSLLNIYYSISARLNKEIVTFPSYNFVIFQLHSDSLSNVTVYLLLSN